jgi:hypothetical protein
MYGMVCRDPRQRRLQQEQEKKLSTAKAPDGSKLSFKEKMRLFAQEVLAHINKFNFAVISVADP